MPRIRSIKPEFFQDEDLAQLATTDRLVFIGILTQADREGRLEDRPARLKVQILPYDQIDIRPIIDRLVAARFLIRYSYENRSYLQIRTFKKHQRPHHTEQHSVLPALEHGLSTSCQPAGMEEGKEEGKEKEEGREGYGEGKTLPPAPAAPKRKTDPLVLLLKNRLGSSTRVCADQVRALRGEGWDDARLEAAITTHAEVGVAPWEWTKLAKGMTNGHAPRDFDAERDARQRKLVGEFLSNGGPP